MRACISGVNGRFPKVLGLSHRGATTVHRKKTCNWYSTGIRRFADYTHSSHLLPSLFYHLSSTISPIPPPSIITITQPPITPLFPVTFPILCAHVDPHGWASKGGSVPRSCGCWIRRSHKRFNQKPRKVFLLFSFLFSPQNGFSELSPPSFHPVIQPPYFPLNCQPPFCLSPPLFSRLLLSFRGKPIFTLPFSFR